MLKSMTPVFESEKDRENQRRIMRIIVEKMPLEIAYEGYKELPRMHTFDYTSRIVFEVKCWNTKNSEAYPLVICSKRKYDTAKEQSAEVSVFYAVEYEDCIKIWDLRTVEIKETWDQPRKDREEDDPVVCFSKDDFIFKIKD